MTKKEFLKRFWAVQYEEMSFLYYADFFNEINEGKAWYTTSQFIHHGKQFKKQLLNHIYKMRGFDLSTLQYK